MTIGTRLSHRRGRGERRERQAIAGWLCSGERAERCLLGSGFENSQRRSRFLCVLSDLCGERDRRLTAENAERFSWGLGFETSQGCSGFLCVLGDLCGENVPSRCA